TRRQTMRLTSRERSSRDARVVVVPLAASPREISLVSRHRGWGTRSSSTGTVIPFRAHRRPVMGDVASRHDDDEPASSAGSSPARGKSVLGEDELRAIEGVYPEGITAVQIVDVFT